MQLAINGGEAVRKDPHRWPMWPRDAEFLLPALKTVLVSNRWTVRGWWTGTPSMDEIFCRDFAQFNNSKYCITTASGSSGLSVALEALGLGFGDEVILPVMTWIAVPVAILSVNAVPVFVDIDPETTCMAPEAIETAITSKTKAILVVHQHCRVADMDKIMKIANKHNLAVIEDCSQSHGSVWNRSRVGSIGDIGVFSMNQEKVLSCGEGGAVITNSEELYNRLEQLRADGCYFKSDLRTFGEAQHVEVEEGLMGGNNCLSEFQAAILKEELKYLDEFNFRKEKNALYLDKKLSELGFKPLFRSPAISSQTYYEYGIMLNGNLEEHITTRDFCNALTAELKMQVHQTDVPLHKNILYKPRSQKRYNINADYVKAIDASGLSFPVAEEIYNDLIVFHHRFLLGSTSDMDDILTAFKKVLKYQGEIKKGCNNEL